MPTRPSPNIDPQELEPVVNCELVELELELQETVAAACIAVGADRDQRSPTPSASQRPVNKAYFRQTIAGMLRVEL